MQNNKYVFNSEKIKLVDWYIKTIIKNTVIDYHRSKNKLNKNLIYDFNIDNYYPYLNVDFCFENKIKNVICLNNLKCSIEDYDLFNALNLLTEKQQSVLLLNIFFDIPLRVIAEQFGFSERMAKKHKHNAIERLKRSMYSDEK